MSEAYDDRFSGIDEAIREGIAGLNQTSATGLSALFLTGEEEAKARALCAGDADRERLSQDLIQLGDALRLTQPKRSSSAVEAPCPVRVEVRR